MVFSKKSKILFIGAGKIAASLIHHLLKSGYNVKGIISRTGKPASDYSLRFKLINHSNNFNSITSAYKIFFLTVPDDQIVKTAGKLSKLKLDFKNSLFIHVSGSENLSSLNSLKKKGAATATFHIMQTFPSQKISKMSGSYSAVETTSREAERFLRKIAVDLNVVSFSLNEGKKTAYHLAGVFAANFLTGNIFITKKIMEEAGIKSIASYDVMKPIIQSTLMNIQKLGPEESLSGPINRGDVKTIKNHIKILKIILQKNKNNNLGKILLAGYLIQSLNLLEIVLKKEKKPGINHLTIKHLLTKEINKIKFQ